MNVVRLSPDEREKTGGEGHKFLSCLRTTSSSPLEVRSRTRTSTSPRAAAERVVDSPVIESDLSPRNKNKPLSPRRVFKDIKRMCNFSRAMDDTSRAKRASHVTPFRVRAATLKDGPFKGNRGIYIPELLLGEGTYARVYKAVDPIDSSDLALKIIPHPSAIVTDPSTCPPSKSCSSVAGGHITIDQKLARADLREQKCAELAVRARSELIIHQYVSGHPNIVALLDYRMDIHFTALTLEYVPHCLFDVVSSLRGLPEQTCKRLAIFLFTALAFLHSKGVIHRDIKLENVLVTANLSTVKLCDFGLSAFWRPGLLLREFCGSVPYTPPEILQNLPYEGPPADVWSTGIVLLASRINHMPFYGNNDQAMMNAIVRDPLYLDTRLMSDSFRNLIGKILHKNPKIRITVAEVLAHPFLKR